MQAWSFALSAMGNPTLPQYFPKAAIYVIPSQRTTIEMGKKVGIRYRIGMSDIGVLTTDLCQGGTHRYEAVFAKFTLADFEHSTLPVHMSILKIEGF